MKLSEIININANLAQRMKQGARVADIIVRLSLSLSVSLLMRRRICGSACRHSVACTSTARRQAYCRRATRAVRFYLS
jgi:hypothetical protein